MFEVVNSQKISEDLRQQSQKSLQSFMARQDLGFVFLPDRKHLWEQSQKVGETLRQKYSNLVVVGIGGSSLGVRVLAQVLDAQNIFFVDNVDATEFENVLKRIGSLEKAAWAFISKSGNTIETLLTLDYVDQIYKERNINLYDRSVVITENKASTLSDWAKKHNVTQCEIPLDVGGRFSVLSPVGLVPAAFLGVHLEQMRAGALAARKNTALIENLMAHFMASYQQNQWITLFWYYSARAHSLGMWVQQLWAESLGKKVDRKNNPAPRASTPMWAIGASDQHSILQQVMEGARDKFVLFHRFEDGEGGTLKLNHSQFPETKNLAQKTMGSLLKAEAMATEEALRSSGVSTLCLKARALDPESLAYYFMLLELIVAGLGEWMDINAFDQPGVELGKRLAKDLLNKA